MECGPIARRVGDNRIYQYGAGSSDDYRVGTAECDRAMEREGRLNRPRGVRLVLWRGDDGTACEM